jgi:hypothetical protein
MSLLEKFEKEEEKGLVIVGINFLPNYLSYFYQVIIT